MSKAIITNWSDAELDAYERNRIHRAMAGEKLENADYILSYEDVADAYRDITPNRFKLLEALQQLGTVSIYALAKALGRHYRGVHTDVTALIELDLIKRTPEGVCVPWESVEWQLRTRLAKAA